LIIINFYLNSDIFKIRRNKFSLISLKIIINIILFNIVLENKIIINIILFNIVLENKIIINIILFNIVLENKIIINIIYYLFNIVLV